MKCIFIIEVKAIHKKLENESVKQAVDYAANKGIDWVILTNGVMWNIYKLSFEKPIDKTLLTSFDISELNLKESEDQNRLYILSKEGIKTNAIVEFDEYKQGVNKFFITAVLQDEQVLNTIRKHIKMLIPKHKIANEKILCILNKDIIKREIVTSEELKLSQKALKKAQKKKNQR